MHFYSLANKTEKKVSPTRNARIFKYANAKSLLIPPDRFRIMLKSLPPIILGD